MTAVDKQKLKLQEKLSQGPTTIGIDIGSSSVNVAQMANYKGKPTLIKTALVNIEKRANRDLDQATLTALHKALAQFNAKKAKYACVVNCPQTCVRKVTTPYMSKEDLRGAVSLEVKRSIPFPLESAVLDFNVIEEVLDKGVEKLSIIAAVSPKETIERLLSYFEHKKEKPFSGDISKKFDGKKKLSPLALKISALLPLSLCLENIIERSKLKTEETLVTVEMGTVVTGLNIYRNSRLQFSRKIPFSGNDITKSLTETLMTEKGKVELTFEEAEKIKRECGIPRIEENRMIDGKITTNYILSLIRPKVEQLANEIERSFDFYREEMHGSKIDRIVLFGGGSQLKGLPEFLGKELGIEVNVGNPILDIDLLFDEVIEHEADAHRLVLAIGAALSSMRGTNLLPVEIKEKTKRSVQKVLLHVGAVLFVLISFLTVVPLKMRTANLQKKLDLIKQELNAKRPRLLKIRDNMAIDKVLAEYPSWSDALKEISNIVPADMYLESINMTNNVLDLKGRIKDGQQASETSLSRFMVDLEKGLFNNVRLVSTNRNKKDPSILEFEINCGIEK